MAKLSVLCVLPLLIAGCANVPMQSGGVDEAMNRFENAWNNHDATALAQVYTLDARLMPPDSPMITGRDAIGNYWKTRYEGGLTHIKLSPVSTEMQGNVAADVRTFVATFKEQLVAGKAMYIWDRNPDGTWSMAAGIWNVDARR